VLATKGTVKRNYTSALIRDFAGDCEVTLVSATRLAGYAEDALHGRPVSDNNLRTEIAPAFVEKDGRRTDRVVLACTHYPLLLDRLERVAPWPVTWIDPAPAIARRVVQLLGEQRFDRQNTDIPDVACFNNEIGIASVFESVLENYGLRLTKSLHL
jgi:glutamate racemase